MNHCFSRVSTLWQVANEARSATQIQPVQTAPAVHRNRTLCYCRPGQQHPLKLYRHQLRRSVLLQDRTVWRTDWWSQSLLQGLRVHCSQVCRGRCKVGGQGFICRATDTWPLHEGWFSPGVRSHCQGEWTSRVHLEVALHSAGKVAARHSGQLEVRNVGDER